MSDVMSDDSYKRLHIVLQPRAQEDVGIVLQYNGTVL